jgi:D-alanyl-lipoteichoic acid acyltransferase DltB (MBOAT superfamily)
MIFSSPVFLLFFPLVLGVFWLLCGTGRRSAALNVLIVASLVYYAWWHPAYVPIIFATIVFNFTFGLWIASRYEARRATGRLVALGVLLNLAPLAYFKYVGFFLEQIGWPEGLARDAFTFLLPLGISFYTFQQIAYLLDTSRGRPVERDFRNYALFVLFFPQLIAGPIVRHGEVMHQFLREARRPWLDIALGSTIFAAGLFKKLVLADGFAQYVNPVYAAAAEGATPGLFEAWTAATAYVFQLYFDFSGYSDMAIGLARCFGIVLPINFVSPYKATTLGEFWRRWHITLVRFVRSYFFQPIAVATQRRVSRTSWSRGVKRSVGTAVPTLVIFTAIGLWHGAGWTFIVFGVIHGALVASEQVVGFNGPKSPSALVRLAQRSWLPLILITTFVIFRAPDLDTAGRVLQGMVDPMAPSSLPPTGWIVLTLVGAVIALACPNVYEFTARYRPALIARDAPDLAPLPEGFGYWRPTPALAVSAGLVLAVAVITLARGVVEFIYFDF